MSQPPPFIRRHNFTQAAIHQPRTPVSPSALDGELDGVLVTLVAVLRNLALIQRDDGALRNGTVKVDTLSPETLLLLGASSQWKPRGEWAPGRSYVPSDVVSDGSRTFVCAIAHTATILDDDISAGRWILIFDALGAVPADGSVTAAKLADGSVTLEKLALVDLSLPGFLIAAGGTALGDAEPGKLFHAKKNSGAVELEIERTTADQGRLGWRLLSPSTTGTGNWFVGLEAGQTSIIFSHSSFGVALTIQDRGALVSAGGALLSGSAPLSSGVGLHHRFDGGVSYSDSYDYNASVWRDYRLRGKVVELFASNVMVMRATADALEISRPVVVDGVDTRDLGIRTLTASGNIIAADRARGLLLNSAITADLNLPGDAALAVPMGAAIIIYNRGTTAWTVKPAAGVTLTMAGPGVTGSRTIAAKAQASLMKIGANDWVINGTGVS